MDWSWLAGHFQLALRARPLHALVAGAVLVSSGCGDPRADDSPATVAEERAASGQGASDGRLDALRQTLQLSSTLADSIEDLLRPVDLLTTARENALRRYSNAANVARARQLGVSASDEAELERLVQAGRLVALEPESEHWVLRDRVRHPYVTPDALSLLHEIGERFQERLTGMGLPPLRFEISSALRTAAGQAALRGRNVNAAAGTSAHEFGTTIDIPYSGYGAPADLPEALREAAQSASPDLAPLLEDVARTAIERMAARKSRELQAILGDVLGEMQAEGALMVTLERLQPVYHITVASPRQGG